MIEAHHVVKAFGHKAVLRGVDLHVAPGEFVTLVGPNGAGKTTLLRILATLARPTGGQLAVAGYALPRDAARARQRLGVVLHQTLLYEHLSAGENLRFYAQLYGLPAARTATRAAEVLEQVGLAARRHDLARTLSRGQQQRLAIARALLHDPAVLLLDEPYTGLDPHAAGALDAILRDLAGQGRTVLMTTHDLARGLALSHRIAILTAGKIARTVESGAVTVQELAEVYAEIVGAGNGERGAVETNRMGRPA